MGTFNGKVKGVTSKQTNQSETETIVVIGGDVNNQVCYVKVTYPSDLNPSETPVVCNFADIQNGDRIFSNDTLTLDSSVGDEVKLLVIMEDTNHTELGRTSIDVTVKENYL